MASSRSRTLRRAAEIEALASAVRLDILAALRSGPAASVSELAHRLQRQPSALYHHLKRLCEAGLVQPAGQRRTARRDETLYALVAPRLQARVGGRPDTTRRAAMARVGQALMRQMARDYERALAEPATVLDGPGRTTALALLSLRLPPARLGQLNAELNALLERWAAEQPVAGAQAVRLALVITPAQ